MKYTFSPGSTPLPGFTIKRAIHQGGFGEVYFGLSNAGKEVALKLLLRNKEVELRGVQQCINLKHPNLVTIFDVLQDKDGDHWIIMEYVAGDTLNQVIEDHPNGMTPEEIWEWLPGIVAGVAHLHGSGIVHRDLKPGNIYREHGPAGIVKVGDVGLSKMISDSERHAQTQAVGTVYYMAPEVSKGNYGQEVDIYSLGVIVYEMVTGGVPFDGQSTGEILLKHLSSSADLTLLPKPLRPVISRTLTKDPQHRTPTVQQFLEEYCAAMHEMGHRVTPQGTLVPTGREQVVISTEPGKRPRKSTGLEETHVLGQTAFVTPLNPHYPHAEVTPPPAWRTWRLTSLKGYLLIAALAAVGTSIFVPEYLAGILGMIACGGALFACYSMLRQAVVPQTASSLNSNHSTVAESPGRSVSSPPARPLTAEISPQQQHRFIYGINGDQLTPETVRFLPWKCRMTELAGSMTVAIFCTLLLTITVSIMTSLHEDLGTVCHFGSLTLIGSWMVLATSKLLEGIGKDSGPRQLTLGVLGVGLGILAWGLHRLLLVSYAPQDFTTHYGFLDHLGPHPLMQNSQPTLVGYMVFFTGLFVARSWWLQVDSFRESRFRISSVLVSLLVGYAMTTIFSFPLFWGMTLAAAISSVVQLSAPWVPPEQRVQVLEGL